MRYLAIAAVLSLSSCLIYVGDWGPREWVVEESSFEVDRADLAAVKCVTHNGRVTVAGSDGDKITVRVKKRAGGRDTEDAEAAMAAIEVLHKRVDGGLTLGWRWIEPRSSSWYANVAFDIAQPRALPIAIETHNGSVSVVGLQAAVSAETHNGELCVQQCSGKVVGTTHNGGIEANVTSAEVALRTHNGEVHVVLGGSGPIDGEITTHNGEVHIDVAGERSARLTCSTNNGRVTCQHTLQNAEIGQRSLVASLGDGRGRLAVETHNGSIRID